jgi:hypothetical protein
MDDYDRALLDALDSTIEVARRLTTLTDRKLTRATNGERLTDQERPTQPTSSLAHRPASSNCTRKRSCCGRNCDRFR